MIRSPCAAFKKAVYDIRGLRSYPRPQEAPLAVILSRRGEILNLEWDQVDLGGGEELLKVHFMGDVFVGGMPFLSEFILTESFIAPSGRPIRLSNAS